MEFVARAPEDQLAGCADRTPLAHPLLPVTLLLAAMLGRQTLLLSLAAQTLALIEWRTHRHGQPGHVFQAAIEIVLPWLAGHATMAPITPTSLLLACCFGLSYQGALSLETVTVPLSRSWSLLLFFAGQALAATSLLFAPTAHTVYLVAGMGLLLAPQALLLVYAGDKAERSSYLRRAAPFVMVSMALAAWVA